MKYSPAKWQVGLRLRMLAIALGTVATADVTMGTLVVGNQEQPKVLYLLPWQAVEKTPIAADDFTRQRHGVFDHVELQELPEEYLLISQ